MVATFRRKLVPQIAALLSKHSLSAVTSADLPSPSSRFFHRSPRWARRGQGSSPKRWKNPSPRVGLEAVARPSGRQARHRCSRCGRRQAFVGDYELHGESAPAPASCAKEHLLSWDDSARSLRVGLWLLRPERRRSTAPVRSQCSQIQDPRPMWLPHRLEETGLRRRRDVTTLEANSYDARMPRFCPWQ